jgi:hypothetical protein
MLRDCGEDKFARRGWTVMTAVLPANCSPPPFNETFETISPALAGALIAANQLAYSHCKLHANGKDAVFVFADSLHVGEELQRRYTAGAFPLVHAKVLAEARGFLADETYRVKGGRHAKSNAL